MKFRLYCNLSLIALVVTPRHVATIASADRAGRRLCHPRGCSRQSMRLTALNAWLANLLAPPDLGPPTCQVVFQFYDSQGMLVEAAAVDNVEPGKAFSIVLNRDDPQRDDQSVQLRGVLKFGYFGGANAAADPAADKKLRSSAIIQFGVLASPCQVILHRIEGFMFV